MYCIMKKNLVVVGYGGMGGGFHVKNALKSDVVNLLGIYDIKVDNPALYQLVLVGNEDFLYKNEIGYQGYSTGSYGTSTSTHSEANEGSAYFALKTYLRECMKGSEEGFFPILPY